jgi:hypothetical protein
VLFLQSFEVDTARLISPVALDTPAAIAPIRTRLNIPLCHFIPPFLLRSAPNLFLLAVLALEQDVGVETPLDKRRNAVAVVRGKKVGITWGGAGRDFLSALATKRLGRPLDAVRLDFGPALLVALHATTRIWQK